ncbi:dTMP kinase [Aliagarivorans marinus]|uniref:dTMP kinase n=1 Tax=Aliagarivorans marinus TaxID=561965 RepID=UPI000428E230|nr:dTMP kinase [Aliagarivorans marinus]
MTGKFIVIEGLEGAGKSTAVTAVEHWLEQRGIHYRCTREPGGTPLAEGIRQLVKHGVDDDIPSSNTELLLMYAARAQLVDTVIQPTLSEGIWVIGDRHDLSSRAYQGGGRELGLNKLSQLKQLAIEDFEPDLTLYLDIDPRIGLERARSRGALDRIEKQHIAFFDRAREVYLAEAETNPRVVRIDASQDMQAVAEAIAQALSQQLG